MSNGTLQQEEVTINLHNKGENFGSIAKSFNKTTAAVYKIIKTR